MAALPSPEPLRPHRRDVLLDLLAREDLAHEHAGDRGQQYAVAPMARRVAEPVELRLAADDRPCVRRHRPKTRPGAAELESGEDGKEGAGPREDPAEPRRSRADFETGVFHGRADH